MKPPVLFLLLLFWPLFGQQTQNVTVSASVPPAVSVSASYRGATGGRTSIYYYVCANYVAGYVCQTQPAVAGNTPGISGLSGSNTVTVTWSNPPGAPPATGYDVMRFQTPVFANPCSSCSIAQGISGNSFVDSSPALPSHNFPPSGLGKLVGASGQITLNNTGYQTPGLFWALNGKNYAFALIPPGATVGDCLVVAAQPPFTAFQPCGGGGTIYYQTIQNNGTPVAQEPVLNFVSGVTCVDDAGVRTNCTASGGGGVGPGTTNYLAGFTTSTTVGSVGPWVTPKALGVGFTDPTLTPGPDTNSQFTVAGDGSSTFGEIWAVTGGGSSGLLGCASAAGTFAIPSNSSNGDTLCQLEAGFYDAGWQVGGTDIISVTVQDVTNPLSVVATLGPFSTESQPFAALASYAVWLSNGGQLYCLDCQVTSPSDNTCTSGGTGSMAFYVNGIWQCSTAGPGPTGITGTLTAGCVPVADSPTDVVCSAASDNGTTFTIAEPVQVGSTGAGFVQPGTTIVGSLPTCNSGALNTQTAVTDALAPTFLNAVTGGGGVFTPVLCNGTDWVATGGGGSPVLVSSLVASGIVDGLGAGDGHHADGLHSGHGFVWVRWGIFFRVLL